MRIALDGCDGTGKTTIAEKLANKFGCNIIRLTYEGDRSIDAYEELMRCHNVVHDRTFLSEIIYPKYFNRESRLEEDRIDDLFAYLRYFKIKLFILTAEDETIAERLNKRGDEYLDDIGAILSINQEYLSIAQEHQLLVIDTTNKTIDEIVDEIGGYLNEFC